MLGKHLLAGPDIDLGEAGSEEASQEKILSQEGTQQAFGPE